MTSLAEEKEWQTRRKRIDPRLTAAGWVVVDHDPSVDDATLTHHAVCEYPTKKGPADYCLFLDGKPVGIVEAKKVTVGAAGILTQAKRYSKGLPKRIYGNAVHGAAFLYATNGVVIKHLDTRHTFFSSRDLAGFHGPDALRVALSFDFAAACKELVETPFKQNPSGKSLRPYQQQAVSKIEDAIAHGRRAMLLSMATGTGKTFTLVSLVDRLLRAKVACRILFLVDRRALAAQAVQAFAAFEGHDGQRLVDNWPVYSQSFKKAELDEGATYEPKRIPESILMKPDRENPFVFVRTIQGLTKILGFSSGEDAAPDHLDEYEEPEEDQVMPPIDAFDLIIADECHRGYTSAETNAWRQTINYLDAIKIGLTATPAPHTMALFKHKVFHYGLAQAIAEDHLVGFDEVHVASGVLMKGVKAQEGEAVHWVDPQTGDKIYDELEDDVEFEAEDVERKVTAPDCTRKVVRELKKYMDIHETTKGRVPKTLIFATNDLPNTSHADALVEEVKTQFGKGDDFVQKITGRVDAPLAQIKRFRNRQEPKVVVSVDLMSTGVDIPDLEFIVLLRQVKSRILWDQMLGRGTRKSPDLMPEKTGFVVVDCFAGTLLESFREISEFADVAPKKPTRSYEQIIQAVADNENVPYNLKALKRRFAGIDKRMTAKARKAFADFVPAGNMKDFGESLQARFDDDRDGLMEILQAPAFVALLYDYERRKRTFMEALDAEDTVTSKVLIRGRDKAYAPADYITAFSTWVQTHRHDIDAIAVLLDRPSDLSTSVLAELRAALKNTEQEFTVEKLRRAYQYELADIISLIKHAVDQQSPLLSQQERVVQAMAVVGDHVHFTADRQEWWDRIRGHLIENLVIERDDFEIIPILSDHGGFGPANRAFGGELDQLIREINGNIAAVGKA